MGGMREGGGVCHGSIETIGVLFLSALKGHKTLETWQLTIESVARNRVEIEIWGKG